MNQIRFQGIQSHNTLSGPRWTTPSPELAGGPNVQNQGLIRPGSVEQLMFMSQMRATPNGYHAAPLVNLQAHTASCITNPSSTPADPQTDWDAWRSFKSATTGNAVIKGLTRASSRLGAGSRSFGSLTGLAGSIIGLPGGIADAASKIERARRTGDRSDIAQATAATSSAGSTGARLVKHSMETGVIVSGQLAKRAGAKAFRQAAPNASKAVVKAAAKQAAKEALKESAAKAARRGVQQAATTAAKSSSTLARGAGAVSRSAAKTVLREGGEAAAKAATKAVAKGAAKTAAKAAGRFVPGVNIAIAGLDTATAAATLADPKASTGKKVTSVITAAGSIVAATNIPVVSQIGAAVSTVSSFIGSFF